MNWWDQIQTGAGDALVNMQSPFGFAPPGMDRQAMIRQSMLNIGTGILANGNQNPLVAAGRGYQMAQEQGADTAMKSYAAKQMMDSAEEKRKEREKAAQEESQREAFIKTLAPDVQMKAKSIPGFLEKYIEATDPAFQTAQSNDEVYGTVYFDPQGKPYVLSKTGEMRRPKGLEEGVALMTPEERAAAQARGRVAGGAPEDLIKNYSTKGRTELANVAESVSAMREAKNLLKKGIQTGGLAEKVTGLRNLGAALGFEVDESVLANTQTYQNFIGAVVIPRMAALGGNDSNEELRKLYSISGGDINQSLAALSNTLDFMEKLMIEKAKPMRDVEEQVLPYLGDLAPVPFPDTMGGSSEGEVTYNPETGEFE